MKCPKCESHQYYCGGDWGRPLAHIGLRAICDECGYKEYLDGPPDDSIESLEAPEFLDDALLESFDCWGDDSPRVIAAAVLCAVGLIAAALSVALFVEWLLR